MSNLDNLRQSSEILKKIYYSAQSIKDLNVPPDVLKHAMDALEEKINGMTAMVPSIPTTPSVTDQVVTDENQGLRIVDPRIESFDVT